MIHDTIRISQVEARMNSENVFGERLLEARTIRDLSQEELAEKADLQSSAVSHFETGKRKPSFHNLRRLADALKVTSDYLLGLTDDPDVVLDGDQLYRDYQSLTEKDRELARDFMKSLAKRSKEKRTQSND